MNGLNDVVRPGWPEGGDELFVLGTFLDFHRGTLAMKCRDLTDDQLRSRPITSSNLSLLGLLRHMRECERFWLDEIFLGMDPLPMFDNSVDPDADFNDLDSHRVEVVVTSWIESSDRCRELLLKHNLTEVSAAKVPWTDQLLTLRVILVHLLEEYARHCGHADLLREAIDGVAGH